MNTKNRSKTRNMVLCALFAALMAVLSQIIVPIGPVPFNLGVLGAFLAGVLLSPVWASASMGVYLLLALVGMPVLAGMQGGPGALFGKTGGYVIGYIAIAFLTSLAVNKSSKMLINIGAMVTGLFICYIFGTLWFMVITKLSFFESLVYCVLPFIIPDIIKLICSYLLGTSLKKMLKTENII